MIIYESLLFSLTHCYLQGCIEQSSGPNNLIKQTYFFFFIVTPTEELEWGDTQSLGLKAS